MFALSFIYVVLGSYLSYIVMEKGRNFVKDRDFWLLVLALALTFYLTVEMLTNF
jgi:hypothetical protein